MSAGFTDEQTSPRPADGEVASILKLPLQADPRSEFVYSNPGRSRGGRGGQLIAVGAANSDGDHCEHDTHPDRWLDTDELIYMINTVITPVPR